MATTSTDRIYGESSGVAVKAPCAAVATTPVPLSGLAAVGGYTPNAGDRILVIAQADPTTNGIYNAAAGAWSRSGDFDGAYDCVQGTLVAVNLAGATTGILLYQLTTPNPITIGSSSLTFVSYALLAPWPQTQAEVLAGVIPTNTAYPPGEWRRYGADPSGATDSTGAINAALLCNDDAFDSLGGTFAASGSLTMRSNQTLRGVGSGTVLQVSSPNTSSIVMPSVTNSVVRDLKLVYTGGAVTASVAGVYLQLSSECTVERVEMTGMGGFGVWIDCSNYCTIQNNYFHGFQASTNFGDVGIYCVSSSGGTVGAIGNRILNNTCLGGSNEFGVQIEDPDAATSDTGFPTRNLIQGNIIGPHSGYGILVYMSGKTGSLPPNCDTYNRIIGNDIQGITGAISSNPSAGAGIYFAGRGIGGSVITDNVVFNCCSGTVNRGLAPAGIGINGGGVGIGTTRIVIANNSVSGMSQGDGILVTSHLGGAVISNNAINMPSTNLGEGTGGPSLLGAGIRVEASQNVSIGVNDVQVYGGGAALYLYANGVNVTDTTVTGGLYQTGGAGNALQATQNGGFTVTRLNVTGGDFNASSTAGTPPDAISLNAVIAGNLANVKSTAASGRALFINGSTNMRVIGGSYTSSGSVAIGTSGVCTDGFISKETDFVGAVSQVNNAGSGINIETRQNAAPTSGTWAVGDHVQQSSPVVGNPKGWFCTVAGTPGTWASEGNL